MANGLTERAHGYGFLAVFVAALALRSAERDREYHDKLWGRTCIGRGFTAETERDITGKNVDSRSALATNRREHPVQIVWPLPISPSVLSAGFLSSTTLLTTVMALIGAA